MMTLSTPAFAQQPPQPIGPAKAQPPASEGRGQPVDLIQKGQAQFDEQQYEESIQTLSAALLRPSNTQAQKVEIYRLLALNYITLGRKDEAENAVRGLLVAAARLRDPGEGVAALPRLLRAGAHEVGGRGPSRPREGGADAASPSSSSTARRRRSTPDRTSSSARGSTIPNGRTGSVKL